MNKIENYNEEQFLKDLEKDKARLDNEKVEDALEEINNEDDKCDNAVDSAIMDVDSIEKDEDNDEKLDNIIANAEEKESDEEEDDEEETLIQVIKLKVPVNGMDEIKLDFSDLNGRNLRKIEKIWEKNRKSKKPVLVNVTDTEYCMFIAAHCSGVPYSKLEELNAGDYSKLKLRVQSFLFGS